MTITKNKGEYPDVELRMRAENERIRVDLVDLGEGYNGDWDPNDPDDDRLLRFDVYYKDPDDKDMDWTEVDDASYCTNLTLGDPEDVLEKAVTAIFKRYDDVATHIISGGSVKKMGEELSWISAEDFEEKER